MPRPFSAPCWFLRSGPASPPRHRSVDSGARSAAGCVTPARPCTCTRLFSASPLFPSAPAPRSRCCPCSPAKTSGSAPPNTAACSASSASVRCSAARPRPCCGAGPVRRKQSAPPPSSRGSPWACSAARKVFRGPPPRCFSVVLPGFPAWSTSTSPCRPPCPPNSADASSPSISPSYRAALPSAR